AHDIRSPLAVLNMMVRRNLEGLPEENRIIIRNQIDRIQDIANNLLVKNKNIKGLIKLRDPNLADIVNNNNIDNKEIRDELLSSAIEEIITEKRLYFRCHLGLSIDGDIYDGNSYGLFAKINLSELKRILSNLINNAAEALPEFTGKIVVKLMAYEENKIRIIVEDNGKGIPPEIIARLTKPYREEITFGKEKNVESGSGLGLYHARTSLDAWDGELDIESQIKLGTRIILTLPRAQTPKWFMPHLSLGKEQAIVILDDDQGIHLTWNNRFKALGIERFAINVFHISNPTDFRVWVHKWHNHYKKVLYLSDYELLSYKESGLDLLEEHSLKNAVLVTSHYENERIRDRCENLGIKLIPKMLAGFVTIRLDSTLDSTENDYQEDAFGNFNVFDSNVTPISFASSASTSSASKILYKNSSNSSASSAVYNSEVCNSDICNSDIFNSKVYNTDYYDYVYIDDDEWLRKCWDMAAKKKNLKLLSLASTKDFEQYRERVSKEHTTIYLDRNLGNNEMHGDKFAEILHLEGYRKLYLATGHGAEQFDHIPWLKITSKECPFDDNQ
ncbi:MAG: HAMP domain-containing histidine kinase, partial [Oligoflexia bacterium]|nr:HAMP domain-containing histidine kinase [Oligoflexia bacterium]